MAGDGFRSVQSRGTQCVCQTGSVAERSLYDVLRRRVAPVVLVAALAVLGSRTCASEMAQVDIHLLFGPAHPRILAVRGDLFPEGEPMGVAYFERHYRDEAAGRSVRDAHFELGQLDPGSYVLRIEARLEGGVRLVERTIYIRDQAQVTIDISDDISGAISGDVRGADSGASRARGYARE